MDDRNLKRIQRRQQRSQINKMVYKWKLKTIKMNETTYDDIAETEEGIVMTCDRVKLCMIFTQRSVCAAMIYDNCDVLS